MADEADIANDYIETALKRALNEVRSTEGNGAGPKTCEECGDKIPTERRNLGFKLCIQCAEESERRKSLFAN